MPTLFSNLIIDGYNHIHLTTNIKKYFSFRIQEHNISSLELVEAFAQPLNVLKEKIGEWITNKKIATLELYFKSLNVYSSKQFYEKSLTALFFFANQFNPEKPDDVISTNAYVARERLLFKNTGKLYKNEKDHKKVIIKLFEQSPIPALFSARLLAEEIKEGTIYDNNLGKFPLEKEEIIEINVGFLKQYLDQSEKFTVQAFWLYHSCDNALKKKNKDAGKLIIDYANEKDIIGFLLFMIHNTTDGGNFIRLSPLILSLFDSYENFTEFLKNVNNDTPEFKEFMVFYNKLVKRNFVSFDYKFKYLKLNRFLV